MNERRGGLLPTKIQEMYKMSINDLLDDDLFLPLLFIVFGIVMIVMGVAVLSTVYQKHSQEEQDRQKPVTEVKAKLISKTTLVNNLTYELIFETEDGQRFNFSVQKNVAELMVDGDTGILKYQGKLFNSFTRG